MGSIPCPWVGEPGTHLASLENLFVSDLQYGNNKVNTTDV